VRIEVYAAADIALLEEHASEATDVKIMGCHDLVEIPDLPVAAKVEIIGCPALRWVPAELPAAESFEIRFCPLVIELPELPVATRLRVSDCPALHFSAGVTDRGNQVVLAKVRGYWRVVITHLVLAVADAKLRWQGGERGLNTEPGHPELLPMVDQLSAKLAARHPDYDQSVVTGDWLFRFPIEQAGLEFFRSVGALGRLFSP
jgi:hypothetical protein